MVAIRRCNSFCLGIACASITWTVSLYLYYQMNWEGSKTERRHNEYASSKESLSSSDNDHYNNVAMNKPYSSNLSSANMLNFGSGGKFKNSQALLDHLQPRDEGYRSHAFNVLVSHGIGYHREVPDTRNFLCKNKTYPSSLPSASIIICFFDEEMVTLLRTVHSVLDRTQDELIHEILLVNDLSTISGLHENLTKYVATNFPRKVKLLVTPNREGLIRARIYGSRRATGEILVFLDSHCEVNEMWLPPLLERVSSSRTHVVTPIIDIINADTFQYTASPLVRGGFNWGLHFKWENFPVGALQTQEDFVKPVRSPTMAGGLFAIDRSYFVELGEYDDGMNIWGGENLEISFRIWMCGGTLEIIPCSRVGHVFRRRRPYGSPRGEDTMTRNSLRVAHVWMDEFKDYFLRERPDAHTVPYGDISRRVALREKLQCHSFSWYLNNVYPELALPPLSPTDVGSKSRPGEKAERLRRMHKKWKSVANSQRDLALQGREINFQPWHSRKRNYVGEFQVGDESIDYLIGNTLKIIYSWYQLNKSVGDANPLRLRLSDTNLCAQSEREILKSKGSIVLMKNCMRIKTQIWYQTDKNELVLGQVLCLDASGEYPRLSKCHEMGGDQEWKLRAKRGTVIYNMAAGTCLGASDNTVDSKLVMEICSNSTLHKWDLMKVKKARR
ncbi:hypothetical protein J437_LFUL007585 [Ladona fulva]|uniref:Polypeptide N-acetylgalactosaminyltransferase n=1 Tax=Ladona fulva TaxID=123851 RepID=A0A8K0K619_LADFU|nr:hypothetical protein J437_LFUL007585 [Ladona fulva]